MWNDTKELFGIFKQTIKEMTWKERAKLIAEGVFAIALVWGGIYLVALAGYLDGAR